MHPFVHPKSVQKVVHPLKFILILASAIRDSIEVYISVLGDPRGWPFLVDIWGFRDTVGLGPEPEILDIMTCGTLIQ